jgi:hypothetical protein
MEEWMKWLSAVLSTRVLVKIVCFLGGILVMKGLSAHYDFNWLSALAAQYEKQLRRAVRLE